MTLRNFSAALCCLTLAAQPARQTGADPVIEAMKAEMQRARALKVAGGQDVPYFFEYALDDGQQYSVVATLGGLVSERKSRNRVPRTQIRVGDYAADNSNYVLSDANFASRFDSGVLPQDNDLNALRHQFWLSTDRTFKSALEAMGRKRAAMRNTNSDNTEPLADFWKAEPVKLIQPPVVPVVDEAAWKARTVKLSGLFSGFPKVFASGVEFESLQTVSYLVNSEGTEIRFPDHVYFVRVRASGLAPDGMTIRDSLTLLASDPNGLPPEAELERATKAVGQNVTNLINAPVGEDYSGPVMFEGAAAAQLFGEVLGSQLAVPRRPVPEPNRPAQFMPSDLEGRIGSRILPSFLTVVDDPTQREYRGRTLLGYYPVDMEGVAPKPLTVVENGTLKNYLLTRQPVKGFTASNGRARVPGNYGHKMAGVTNLFVKSSEPVAAAELRKRLIDLVKQRSKPYGILVRKMDFPSTASLDEVRRMVSGRGNQGMSSLTSSPLLVYRVYPDGREELVRGVRFRNLNARALRDIVAATDEQHQFDYLANGAPMALVGFGSYIWGVSAVAPSVLFDELELERPQMELPKLPVVPPPDLTASAGQ